MSDSPAAILHNTSGTEVATAANPLRVDPTGNTAQPVTDNGSSLTVDGSVSVSNFPAVQPVSDNGSSLTVDGTVTANAGTGPWPVTDNGGSLTTDTPQLPAVLVGGRLDVVVGAPLPAGTNNIGDVDVLSVPAPLSTTGGGTEAAALRVTLANDSTGLVSVDDNGSSLTVDTPQLPAALVGGRLDVVVGASLPAGTNNIGDVDVLSVPAPLSTTGGGTEAAALRVTVASDSTGVLSVDDNGGSLTVDTPQLPPALVGSRLDTNIGSWLGSTAPTVGQKLRAASVPVTMASDQPAIPVTFTETSAVTGVSSAILTLGGSTAGTLIAMRATAYAEPAAAAQRSVASTSALDTAAGTGARTVQIRYFDDTGAGPFDEIVTLNGTTPVNTVATNIRFIESMFCPTVGSTGNNQGVITLYGSTAGGGGTVGTIGRGNIVTGVGDMRTLWCHHYSPVNTVCAFSTLVAGIQSGGSGTNGRFFLRVAKPLVPNGAEVQIGDVLLIIGAFTRNFDFHQTSDGFLRAVGYCVPGVNNASVSMAFDWQEVAV